MSKEVKVEQDGLKLGWHIVLLIVTAGLGVYAASYVAPLKQDIAVMKRDISYLKKEVGRLDKGIDAANERASEVSNQLNRHIITTR